MTTDVPRIPYRFPYPASAAAETAVLDVLRRRIHYFGPYTEAVEAKLARLCEVGHTVAVGSGSAGLLLVFHACGIGPGDEVVVPANIYMAVPEALMHVGAVPILVDVEDDTGNIAPDLVQSVITPRTRAIVVQHTYGHPADMDPLVRIAERNGLRLVEDAAHALGGAYKGRPTGGLGDVGMFAFSNKGISACGVGGAVTTNDAALAADMRMRRYHGRDGSYECRVLGYNFRLPELVAAVASLQLDSLADWNARRVANAARYRELLRRAAVPAWTQTVRPDVSHTYLHFVIRVKARDALRQHLAAHGIEAAMHYPSPFYLHTAFQARLPYGRGAFPVAESICAECLSLPCHPGLSKGDIEYVVAQVARFYA